MARFKLYGTTSPEESQREIEHRALARRAAADGIVLLENDGVLPLKPQRIALFGAGARHTTKGGRGSGDVHERYSVTVEDGLKNAGFVLADSKWLDRVQKQYESACSEWHRQVSESIKGYGPARTMQMFIRIGEQPKPQPVTLPVEVEDLPDGTDTAIYVLARQAGEGDDRRLEKGQYYLSNVETESLRLLSSRYPKLILVVNAAGVVDLSILDEIRVNAVVLLSQPGLEGGNALADVLTGTFTPSGRLTDTWAFRYEDYPSAMTFSYLSGDLSHNEYREGTYVGYRWFEANKIKPRYPFGYGQSYTSFAQKLEKVSVEGTKVTVSVTVQNVGKAYSGKDTALVFLRRPGDGARRLAAFGKSRLLRPGETQEISLSFDLSKEGLCDEAGAKFVLYSGEYGLYLGDEAIAVLTLSEEVTTETVEHICRKNHTFEDFSPEVGTNYPASVPRIPVDPDAFHTLTHDYQMPEPKLRDRVRALSETLTDDELVQLVVGGGYDQFAYCRVPGACGNTATKLTGKGIPNVVMSDGPAGLNVNQLSGVTKGGFPCFPNGLPEDWQWGWLRHVGGLLRGPKTAVTYYHYMTAFPCETMQAQSFDPALMEEIGSAIGREMEEIGVAVWLAPGMNLHRNPLCGRNFEYYSEDAMLTGKMAAALTKGVQSHKGCFVTIKHFCCNNQEDNRTGMSAELSEKTLRETYLRSFRIAVEEAKPGAVMSSYNMVNDVYTPNSFDLCTKVLRNEWGFEGVVMSDWNAVDQCSYPAAIHSGNDLIMPGTAAVRKALKAAYKRGELDSADLRRSALRVLNLIFASHTSEGF